MDEMMTQDQRLTFLVEAFKADSGDYQNLTTPIDTSGRQRVLRSLMNIRMPGMMPDPFADNLCERSELDYLLFNDPAAYADLVLNEDPGRYLKAVVQYKTDESMM